MYEAFIYKWTNKTNGKYYIGYHKGTPDDGYISSGKTFLAAYEKDPDNFYREILLFGKKEYCRNIESKLILQAIKIDGYSKIYNRTSRHHFREPRVRCLHCNSTCATDDEFELANFESRHFLNCDRHPRIVEANRQLKVKRRQQKEKERQQKEQEAREKRERRQQKEKEAREKRERAHRLKLARLSSADRTKYEIVTPAGVFQYKHEAATHFQISIDELEARLRLVRSYYLRLKKS